jgi:hypothetical protein
VLVPVLPLLLLVMSPVGYCRDAGDAAALLVLRRTADAVATGEHVLIVARRLVVVLGNNAVFCFSRYGTDSDMM